MGLFINELSAMTAKAIIDAQLKEGEMFM